jgi:hypothetical protein
MIHSSFYEPRVYPLNGNVAPAEIDRAQTIDPTVSLNREKIEEIGRDGVVGYIKKTPTIGYRLTQLEYGSMEFWRKVTNKADSVLTLTLNDFKTPTFDICGYLTDDDGTFRGTIHYPKLRTSGFSLSIGDPDAIIERSFDFVGEKATIWQGDNKYFIYLKKECGSGETGDVDIVIGSGDYADYPDPVQDPDTLAGDNSDYFVRIIKVKAGVTTEMNYGSASGEFEYVTGTKTITVHGAAVDDVYKVYYTASSYITGGDPFVENDSDPAGILADSCDIYVYIPGSGKPSSSDYLYRVQSATIDVSFDREDVKEIGNREVVKRGIRDKTVTVTLGRILEQFTMEEVLRGVASGYGKIDIEKFTDQAAVIVKVYEDNTKSTFKYGFKMTGLTGSELRGGPGINAYVNKENALEGEDLTITSDAGELGI